MPLRHPGTLHLLIGPVGAGKTTYAERRTADASGVLLDLDACMVRLFAADQRPPEGVIAWYLERRERCRGLLWALALDVLRSGTDVFLELGLVSAAEREDVYRRAREDGLPLVVYLLDAPRDVRRERVARRNAPSGRLRRSCRRSSSSAPPTRGSPPRRRSGRRGGSSG